MTDEPNMASEEQLISYLDGELPPEQAHQLETVLADDPEMQRRLQQHQRAWDLLDALPQTDVNNDFTRSTVEMVALSVSAENEQKKEAIRHRDRIGWWIVIEVLVVAALLGFIGVRIMVTAPNRQLVEDLRVLEDLDAYRNAEAIEFLRALDREGLFGEESYDDL